MRSEYSIKNSISSLICNIIMMITSFISKTVFIKILNIEYLGISGLFENIFSLLNFFELGIGSAIIYNLYKPIYKKNTKKIKSLVFYYKKTYKIISLIILSLSIILLPFIKKITGEISVNVNIYIVYCLFIINTLLTYTAAYKKSFMIANQKSFIINIIHTIYIISMNTFQIAFLIIFKNFYIYLIIKIIFQLLENIIICLKTNHDYPFLTEKKHKELDKTTKKDIYSRVKALINHKFGAIVIFGTDNIIISIFFGIITVGLYANYSLIVSMISTLFSGIICSTTSSVGNLLVENNKKKNMKTFKKINLLNFWIATFTSISLFLLIQPFIQFWLGKEYLLDFSIVIVIIINYYQTMMRNCYSIFKDSAGIWIEDKYIPFIESFLNITTSILLLKLFGLKGVFLGTITSSLIIWFYSYPKFVYKKILGGTYHKYIKNMIMHILIFITILCISFTLSNLIKTNSIIITFCYNILIALSSNIILLIIYFKNPNFTFFINLIKKKMH